MLLDHCSIIMGKAWSIDGGMLGVSLALFVLSTWDKMARLGEVFINEYLVKTHNLNRTEMGALHLYFVILTWNLYLAFAFGRLSLNFTVNFLCGHFARLSWYDCTFLGKQNNVKINTSSWRVDQNFIYCEILFNTDESYFLYKNELTRGSFCCYVGHSIYMLYDVINIAH